MARAATVIVVVVFLQRSKLHKHRLLYSRRLVPSLSVCLSSSLQSFLTFSSRSRLGTGDTRHRRSRSRGRWRGESEDLSQIWLEFRDKRKTNFQTPLWTGDVTRTDALNMASFTSFFPRNVATSLIFLQTNLLNGSRAPFFSSQIRHQQNPWLASIFLVRNFTKIQKIEIKGNIHLNILIFPFQSWPSVGEFFLKIFLNF
jgi:hypothetical protein